MKALKARARAHTIICLSLFRPFRNQLFPVSLSGYILFYNINRNFLIQIAGIKNGRGPVLKIFVRITKPTFPVSLPGHFLFYNIDPNFLIFISGLKTGRWTSINIFCPDNKTNYFRFLYPDISLSLHFVIHMFRNPDVSLF